MWSADSRARPFVLAAVCVAAALLAACQRDAPTELGPETAAIPRRAAASAEPAAPSRVTPDAVAAADAITGKTSAAWSRRSPTTATAAARREPRETR